MPATFTRRRFLQTASSAALTLAAGRSAMAMPTSAKPPNVLFIAVDDLNDWIGCLGGHPQVRTPNLDRLAARGMVFANTSCPAPICTPARTAVLTGKHPSSSGLYFLAPTFRDTPTLKDAVTLPQHFREHGYHTMSVGKVFHGQHDAPSWDEDGRIINNYGPSPDTKLSYPKGHPLWDWGAYPTDESATPDERIADWAVQRLNRPYDQPFFLAAGFFRPHVPMYAPPKWFEAYPEGKTTMPEVGPADRDDVSDYAMKLTHAAVAPRHADVLELGQWEHAVRSYLASVSYVDHQIGKVLDALAHSPHAAQTLVVFWADHGFHLGEHRRWGKRSLWEESTRVPMILAGPGIRPGRTDQPTGTIDLYPTLTELAGLPSREGLDGDSLAPLLTDPQTTDWRAATVCTFGPGNHGVRSRRYRYIRYADGSEELYDHDQDPYEWRNLAYDKAYTDVIADHRRSLPAEDAPLVPGSAGSDSPLFP